MNTRPNPIRTLVVDDSEDECMLLHAELRLVPSVKMIGFVHDGIEAIAYVRGIDRFKDRDLFPFPDLILLDFRMPRCDGMGVLNFLRRQLRRPRVILWSSTVEQINVPLALHLGADMVCKKPSDYHELKEIIRRLEARLFTRIPSPLRMRAAPSLWVHS
jgi:two-component system response regulator